VSCRVYVTHVRRPVLRTVHAQAKLSLFIILFWSHGVLLDNILKNSKHSAIQEKARRIQAGMCTEPKLTSNWHSCADTLSLSPTAVASLHVRNPRHHLSTETFLARKICSWTELFVNRIVREQGRSWTEVPLCMYIYIYCVCVCVYIYIYCIWTYILQRWKSSHSICCTMFQHWISE
jgi:hypothetical protein